jgi:molecular chaperone DnaJ
MRAAKRDYYETLEVTRTATDTELKVAYRRLAVKYHPDHNPDDAAAEDSFKQITEAYAVLSDPQKRQRYDSFGHAAFNNGQGFGASDLGSISDMIEGFFDEVFGRRPGSNKMPKDLSYNLELSFEEAALGADKRVDYERQELCERCAGRRAEPGAASPECPACRGRGEVRYQRGFFVASRPCSTCEGSGVRADARCTLCHGLGTQARKQSLTVKIPAGVEDGAVRTVRGAGEQTPNGNGDLHVHIRVRAHSLFTRDGADIVCEVPVSFPQAALGAQIEVPTLEGKVTMKLPAGTQSGKQFRLRGKGLPIFGGYGKGDELVTVVVEVPLKLTERQRDLLEQLAEAMEDTDGHQPRRHGFLEKLKTLFE